MDTKLDVAAETTENLLKILAASTNAGSPFTAAEVEAVKGEIAKRETSKTRLPTPDVLPPATPPPLPPATPPPSSPKTKKTKVDD